MAALSSVLVVPSAAFTDGRRQAGACSIRRRGHVARAGSFEMQSTIADGASSLWLSYVSLLNKHPLLTKSVTAGLLNAISDAICQVWLEKARNLDLLRLLSFSAIGIFMSGPGMHIWYGLLPRIIPVPGTKGLLLRLAADQFVFTPLGTAVFFAVLLTLEGRNQELWSKLQQDWLPTVLANWKVWIPFQLINFGFVPPSLQTGAACLLGVVWSIFISFAGHKSSSPSNVSDSAHS